MGTYVFPGGSLTLDGDLSAKAALMVISNLVICGDKSVAVSGANSSIRWQVLDGTMELSGTSWDHPARILTQSATQLMEVKSKITGSGTLKFVTKNVLADEVYTRITGDNSEFYGQLRVGWMNSNATDNRKLVLEFDAPENLGGPLAAFDYRALGVDKDSALAPRKPMTLDAANRGLWLDTCGRIIVTNGTFGIKWPIRMTGSMVKLGEGVLALGGGVSFGAAGTDAPSGANNVLSVEAGGILPLATNGFARLSISFAEGSRLVADAAATDVGVKTYGLLNEYGAFALPSDGKLHVKLVGCGANGRRSHTIPLCNVTTQAASALDGNIAVDKIRGWSMRVSSENVTVNGRTMVKYTCKCAKQGFGVIVH